MGKYFIMAILLNLFVVACFQVWERSAKRKMNAAKKKGFSPFKASPKEDIIGKSKFTLRQSKPQATTLIMNEKRTENASIFADVNEQNSIQNAPAAVLPSPMEQGLPAAETGNDSGDIDIVINDEPEGEFEPDNEDGIDYWESEEAEDSAGASMAQGVSFDELSGMLRTVETIEDATAKEKEEAGRVLVEVRKTELFEQVVSDKPKKKTIVSGLMDEYLTAFYRKQEAQPDPVVKVPADFNARSFASMSNH